MFFRGYVETRNKKCIEKFKNRSDLKTYEQVQSLPEFAGILAPDTVLIDVDDSKEAEILFRIVKDRGTKCRIYKTTRGMHFLFVNNGDITSNRTGARLAVGLHADIKLGTRNSYSVLKFNGKEREILLDTDDPEEVPFWLMPMRIKKGSEAEMPAVGMGKGDGRNSAMFSYILKLEELGLVKEDIKETLRIINGYVLGEPLSEKELNTAMRDEAFIQNPRTKKPDLDALARDMMQKGHIIRINNQLHTYMNGVYMPGNENIESEIIDAYPGTPRAKRSEIISYLDVLIRTNTKPDDANFIAFANGIYNVITGTMHNFSPDRIVTNRIDYAYDPQSYCEITDKTLDKMACGDREIRMLLEECIGYTFFRRNELGKFFILTGEKANGKSTFLAMVKSLLGERNTSSLDLKELGDRFKTAELYGKLANIGDDISDEFITNTGVLKKLVTGDSLNVERKGQDPFDFSNYSKLLFSANSIPRMGKGRDSGAILRRIIIIPFNATFSKADPDYDPFIKYKLCSDDSMQYLIRIGIEGLKRVLSTNGFTESKKVKEEISEYEEINNPIIGFFRGTDKSSVINESTSDVYRSYQEYCIDCSIQPVSKTQFSRQACQYYDLTTKPRRINKQLIRIFIKKEK